MFRYFIGAVYKAILVKGYKKTVKMKTLGLGWISQRSDPPSDLTHVQGSISQRVRTSPNLGLVLGDMKTVRLVLS